MEALKLVRILCTEAMHYNHYRQVKAFQDNSGHTSGNVAKWIKPMDLIMKVDMFKSLSPIYILSFRYNFKTARNYNKILEEQARWHLQ